MNFELDPEQVQFRDSLRAFFEKRAPGDIVARLDRDHAYPQDIVEAMGEMGLYALATPEEYGGSPADNISLCIAVEEIARAGATLLNAWIPTITCSRIIARHGSPEQRAALLPRTAAGDLRFAVTLSEPEAGSDLTTLAARAERAGEAWDINGQKVFITGADSAHFLLALVRTADRSDPGRGLTLFLVPTDAPGVTIRPLDKLSGQGTHTCEVFFHDVRASDTDIVGGLGQGLNIVFSLLDHERITCAAQSIGLAEGAFDKALKYAGEREQFGQPIIEFQAVAHRLADMAIRIEQARLLAWQAATKLDAGAPCALYASMAKVAASEAGTFAASNGMQILGGYSYMVEYGMERYWRESKLNEIVAGTNEIQRNMIAKYLRREGGLPNGAAGRR